ncbi:MAG: hypothetical protein P4L73_08040 [Caulobacteraceae bacterium]|nr:hypothetical protein [Caulobacteraceae bacterium]
MSLLERLLPPPAMFAFPDAAPAGWCERTPPLARPDRYYLHVRSVAANASTHLFQFAMADEAGNVALSLFVRAPSPVGEPAPDGMPADAPIVGVDWAGLDAALLPFKGALVVTFGRLVQGAFLPPNACAEIAGLDCARARFVKTARRRGLRVDPAELADVNDARRLVGLPTVRSPDAALRALSLRELCLWMDGEG